MLVLSRRLGEEIVIGANIRIRVGSVDGGRVKLLIDAPREFEVRRDELPAFPAVMELSLSCSGL